MAKWLPLYGFTCSVHHLDARVGGGFWMTFTNSARELGHSFGEHYLELVENQKLRYSDQFDDASLPGAMETTVVLVPASCGTEVTIIQSGIPEAIPVEMCCLGWQESLTQPATLVEPEITG